MMGPDVCRHWRGFLPTASGAMACGAGVELASVALGGDVRERNLPCVRGRCPGASCALRDFPSQASASEAEESLVRAMERVGAAREAIVSAVGPHLRGSPGASGEVDCPCCGAAGALRYRRAGRNGHVSARCRTDGCVSWVE